MPLSSSLAGVQAGYPANFGGLPQPGAAAVAGAAGAGGGAGGASPLDSLVSLAQLAIVSGAPEVDIQHLLRQAGVQSADVCSLVEARGKLVVAVWASALLLTFAL